MRFTSIVLALGLSALSACASKQGAGSEPVVPQNGNTSADPNMDCRTERPIGSTIPRTNCESNDQREMDREGARNMHSNAQLRQPGSI